MRSIASSRMSGGGAASSKHSAILAALGNIKTSLVTEWLWTTSNEGQGQSWFDNNRLLEPIGHIPPAEAEVN